MWKNNVEQDRPQITIWHMRLECWIPKAINAHAHYAMLLAFYLRQWLQKVSVLRHMYIDSLVRNSCVSWIYVLNNSTNNFMVPSFRNCVERSKGMSKYFCVHTSRPPLWSSGQSFWLQIQRSRVRFPALPDFLSSSGSGTGSTQPREVN